MTPHAPKIAIIGAGVIGLSTAWQCARAGLQVTLFERDGILARQGNTGCSAYSLGSLVPYTPTRQHDTANFQRASLKSYPQFLTVLEADSGAHIHYQTGRLQLLTTAGKRESAAHDLTLNPTQGKLLTADDIAAQFPYVTPLEFGAFWCEDSAYVNPVQMLQALHAACMKTAVTLQTGQAVMVAEIEDQFDHIIVAAGAGSDDVLGTYAQPETEVEQLYGHGLALHLPQESTLPSELPLIRQNEIYLCRHGDEILLGSDATRVNHARDTLPAEVAVQNILEIAQTMLPELKTATVTSVWRAPRPKAKNRAAPIRAIQQNITLLTGHYKIGFCLAPKIAMDVAQNLKSTYM